MNIALSFGTPEHGWLSVRLSRGEMFRELDVSDVPADSLHMLATAVLHLLEARSSEATVAWFLEPEEETWTFRRERDVYQLDVRGPGHSKMIHFAAGTAGEICAPVWRALRRLQADPAWSSGPQWSHPFPTKEVDALRTKIRRGERS